MTKTSKKIVIEAPIEEVVEVQETPVAKSKEVSIAYTQFEALIEAYAKQNPVKYELKKEELLSKLNLLK